MASRRHGTLYVGVTSDLYSRAQQHREGLLGGFTKKYGVTRLVWWEDHPTMPLAIARERSLKKYKRDWKINLIERENSLWRDLYEDLLSMEQRFLGTPQFDLPLAEQRPERPPLPNRDPITLR